MSTTLSIKAKCSTKILEDACSLALTIEKQLSAYDAHSDIVHINREAGVKAVRVDPLTLKAITLALEIAEATKGLYDPTIGALSHFGYGFGWSDERLLTDKERQSYAKLVDYRNVSIEGDKVKLEAKGMALDLGGIGKGFTVDMLIAFLRQSGCKKALVSLGGEVYGYGKSWKVAVTHPRNKSFLGVITCDPRGMGVTTSGDYERYIEDYEHHHILNAQQGSSVNLWSSLTLVSKSLDSSTMDALNTALFQLTLEDQDAFHQHYDLEFLAIDKQLVISASKGLKAYYQTL